LHFGGNLLVEERDKILWLYASKGDGKGKLD